jgi:hypothetical protein
VAQPRPVDERSHEPDTRDAWSESWGFDFGSEDGTAGFVRLCSWPGRGVAWWWAYLVGADIGLVVVRDHEVPLPHRDDVLEIRADSLWGELVCETPFEHWGIGMEAFGVRLDGAVVLTADGDEIGERLAVGLDLEWEVASPVTSRATGDGYSQGGVVHGELLVGTDRIAFDGQGVRDHVWGVPGAGALTHRLTAMLGDDVAIDAAVDSSGAASGWVWELDDDDDVVVPIHAVLAEDSHAGSIPSSARWVIANRIELDLDVGAAVAIPHSGVTRAFCVATCPDGDRGTAWLEWRTA